MADDPSPDDAADDPGDASDPVPERPPSLTQRLSRAVIGPGTPRAAKRPTTDAEVKRQVIMLDPTERKIGNLGALFAALLSIAWTYKGIGNPKSEVPAPSKPGAHKSCPRNAAYAVIHGHATCLGVLHEKSYWIMLLAVGLVFAAAIFATTRSGRRAPLGFAALMTGLAYDSVVGIYGIPFLIFGGWLLVRAYRAQKYGTVNAKEAAQQSAQKRAEKRGQATPAAGTAPATKTAPGTKASAPRGRTKRGKVEATMPDGRPAPVPNKRYTPKTPQRKKVTPPPT